MLMSAVLSLARPAVKELPIILVGLFFSLVEMGSKAEPPSWRRRDLNAQQLVGEDVPEDGEEEEGDEGEDDDPPGALLLQALLVAAQDEQPHADAHHRARQVGHEAGLRPRRRHRRREAQPDGAAHLRTHCRRNPEISGAAGQTLKNTKYQQVV